MKWWAYVNSPLKLCPDLGLADSKIKSGEVVTVISCNSGVSTNKRKLQ